MDFVAIDFETANECRSSACAIGIAVVSDYEIVERKHFLIKPPTLFFNPYNVAIHGIRGEHVINEPKFDQLWPKIKCYFEKRLVVAHNASFDISVLRKTLDEYRVLYPEFNYSCTRIISKATWPNHMSYALNYIADYLGIEFLHHNAEEDAVACAKVLIKASKELGIKSHLELAEICKLKIGRLYPGGYDPSRKISCKVKANQVVANKETFDQNHLLYGKKVVFTGKLQSMPRKDAMQQVVDIGGICVDSINKTVNYLVIGENDMNKLKGKDRSSKMLKVEKLVSEGYDIEVIGESEFLKILCS